MKGIFVTFEGVDGTGKSTQARLFAERLQAAGYDPVLTREPGGTVVAEKIREILLTDYERKSPEDRGFTIFRRLRPTYLHCYPTGIGRGKMVICERFSDSTVAYQVWLGTGSTVLRAADGLLRTVETDLTFPFTLSPEEC